MIPLLDASPAKITEIAAELGTNQFGQLITPLTGYRVHEGVFGVDNGGYTTQNIDKFRRTVTKITPYLDRCKFVAMPDVVGSAIRTLELFYDFIREVEGYPLALVIQDGQEHLPIPWNKISAVFIAGSGEWKMTPGAKHIIAAAKWRKKWVHVGRISNPEKWKYFADLGCDSADSSALVRPFPGRREGMREAISSAIPTTIEEIL